MVGASLPVLRHPVRHTDRHHVQLLGGERGQQPAIRACRAPNGCDRPNRHMDSDHHGHAAMDVQTPVPPCQRRRRGHLRPDPNHGHAMHSVRQYHDAGRALRRHTLRKRTHRQRRDRRRRSHHLRLCSIGSGWDHGVPLPAGDARRHSPTGKTERHHAGRNRFGIRGHCRPLPDHHRVSIVETFQRQ